MKVVYQEAAKLSKERKPFVLATVVNTKGSTPQKPGASLLVREDGSTVGTLGGGCVEGDIWFAAKEALKGREPSFYKEYYLNEDIAARDGLVCGGSMYFFIDPVLAPEAVADINVEIDEAYAGGPTVAVATLVKSERLSPGARLLARRDGSTAGTLGDAALDAEAIARAPEVMPLGKTARIANREGDEVFVQGFTSPATLVLLGGGHVNLQVAKIGEIAGFRVFVADDREQFANKERFPMADMVSVASYDHCLDDFPINANTYVVVGTRGHNFDDLALEVAARSPASYVGLLGSKRKTILIYEALLKRGVPLERIKQIRSPIGLDIGGRNPEEIAVSIVSELLAFRYGHPGTPMKLDDAQIDKVWGKVQGTAKVQ